MYQIEILEKHNHIESRKLWEHGFPEDSGEFLDAYYSGKGDTNEISVIRDENGEICSMIHWNPVELMIGEQKETVDYLVAVATREDMRRKGMMSALLKAGLEERKEKGMPFVFLTPANEAYYAPFGFETVGQSFQCGLKDVDSQKSETTGKYKVRRLQTEEYESASNWANDCLKKYYKVFAVRSPKYFQVLHKELASEGGDIAGVFFGDELKGLFVYTIVGGVEVREPICLEDEVAEVYGAIKEYFLNQFVYDKQSREGILEKSVILGCSPQIVNRIPGSKTMVHALSKEGCEGILWNLYLNEIV